MFSGDEGSQKLSFLCTQFKAVMNLDMPGSSDSTLFAATTLSRFNKCFSNSRPLQASERKGKKTAWGKDPNISSETKPSGEICP